MRGELKSVINDNNKKCFVNLGSPVCMFGHWFRTQALTLTSIESNESC